MTPTSPLRTWVAWIAANAIGELLGLGVVFACGFAFLSVLGEPRSFLALLLLAVVTVALGAFEGVTVGYVQWRVLRTVLPAVSRGRWLLATTLGAVVAWLLGMIPSTMASLQSSPTEPPPQEPPQAIISLLAAGMGAVGGIVLAFAQWRVLRGATEGSRWWLPANAAAWALAMPWIFFLVSSTIAEQRTPRMFLLFFAGLAVAGALVGAIHGVVLVRFLKPK